MVARRSDAARSVADRVIAAGQRISDVRQEGGRGAPALRNSFDQRVLLDPDTSTPRLVPSNSEGEGEDVSLKFGPQTQSSTAVGGVVQVRSRGDSNFRDLEAQSLRASAYMEAEFGIETKGQVQADGYGVFPQGVLLGAGQVVEAYVDSDFMRLPGGIITTDVTSGPARGQFQGWEYFGGTYYGVWGSSERRLKDHIEDVSDGLSIVNSLRPARWWWKDRERDAAFGDAPRPHVGIYVDEVPDEAVEEQKELDPGARCGVPNGELTYDRDAIIAYLVAAVQELSAEVDALKAQAGP